MCLKYAAARQTDLSGKIITSLAGAAFGDALGMPVESMTREEIVKATDGQGVNSLIDPIQTKIPDLMDLKAGDTTDDWQLTKAVAEAITTAGKYDRLAMAWSHVEALENSPIGWGKSTQTGIQELADFFNSDEKEGRHYNQAVSADNGTKGAGNGIAMKVAPLAIYHLTSSSSAMMDSILSLGEMTHYDKRASIAAFAVAQTIRMAILFPFDGSSFVAKTFLRFLIAEVKAQEARLKPEGDEQISTVLQKVYDQELFDRNIELIISEVGTGCFCLQSVPFSITIFLRYQVYFEWGMIEAVNAGGDTDTNASMVGAMIGANMGKSKFVYPEWSKRCSVKMSELEELARDFLEVVEHKNK